MAHGAGSLIARASSFVRTSWHQLRTGEADGAGQDAGDAAAASGSTAAGGEKPEAARAGREREQADAVAQAKAAVRREMKAELNQAKAKAAEATAAMDVAVQQHAAEMEAAKNISKMEAAAAAAAGAVVKDEALRDALKAAGLPEKDVVERIKTLGNVLAGLSKEGVVACMKNPDIDTVKKLKTFSASEIALMVELTKPDKDALGECISRLHKEADGSLPEDDDLSTIKARTMYKMVEDVEDSKSGIKKLLFLSSKQADLIARDPSAIDKMLAIFVDKQQPRMVINLLPSMIRCWTRVRPPPGDPDGEREGLAALDRFMAKHIIPLAEKTHAIIVCSAVQPFCVLSESLSRMVKLVRSRWGPELPFTILSCTGQLPALYTVKREDTTWREIRNLSRVWKKREKEGLLEEVEVKLKKHREKGLDGYLDGKNFDMDLDPNGTNFIIVDPTSSCSSAKYDSYNRLITEIVRKLAAEFPSIAIQTGKSKFSSLAESNASGIEVALSNMETGTPVLMLDLTKRDVMPKQLAYGQQTSVSSADVGPAASKPTPAIAPEDENSEPAAHRQQQIEWHRAQVENEERRRVQKDLPDYDWDVCMISHFHDGARRSLTRLPATSHIQHALHSAGVRLAVQCFSTTAITSPLRRRPRKSTCA